MALGIRTGLYLSERGVWASSRESALHQVTSRQPATSWCPVSAGPLLPFLVQSVYDVHKGWQRKNVKYESTNYDCDALKSSNKPIVVFDIKCCDCHSVVSWCWECVPQKSPCPFIVTIAPRVLYDKLDFEQVIFILSGYIKIIWILGDGHLSTGGGQSSTVETDLLFPVFALKFSWPLVFAKPPELHPSP